MWYKLLAQTLDAIQKEADNWKEILCSGVLGRNTVRKVRLEFFFFKGKASKSKTKLNLCSEFTESINLKRPRPRLQHDMDMYHTVNITDLKWLWYEGNSSWSLIVMCWELIKSSEDCGQQERKCISSWRGQHLSNHSWLLPHGNPGSAQTHFQVSQKKLK